MEVHATEMADCGTPFETYGERLQHEAVCSECHRHKLVESGQAVHVGNLLNLSDDARSHLLLFLIRQFPSEVIFILEDDPTEMYAKRSRNDVAIRAIVTGFNEAYEFCEA